MRFDTQAFLSLSLSTRAEEIFCEMIARFFFPVDFLQGLYRDSPTRRHINITRGLHIPGSVLPKLTPEIRFDTQAFLSLSLSLF